MFNVSEQGGLTSTVVSNVTGLNATEQEDYHIKYNWPVLFLFTIVFLALGGNILVCLAVKHERKLQNMFNFFLVSLALSDMLSATLVMPLSIVKAFIDRLPVPKLMCVAWYSLDVLFTSSTIIHLCMISIDRYMSLKYPFRYGHGRTTRHTVFKIVLVWIISVCIAGPLFILSMLDKQSTVYYKGCGPESPTFVISATLTSFYLPLLIMTIMYILTVRALHTQRRDHKKMTSSMRDDSDQHSFRKSTPRTSPNSSVKSNGREPSKKRYLHHAKEPLQSTPSTSPTRQSRRDDILLAHHNGSSTRDEMTSQASCSDAGLMDPRQAATLFETKRKFRVRTFKMTQRGRGSGSGWRTPMNGADKGRRAVQVLGILFVVFVVCYLPFFAAYVINGTCFPCREYISPQMITAFEWLAYSGSMVNPIVYHIFNPDFRKAFDRILRCQTCRRC